MMWNASGLNVRRTYFATTSGSRAAIGRRTMVNQAVGDEKMKTPTPMPSSTSGTPWSTERTRIHTKYAAIEIAKAPTVTTVQMWAPRTKSLRLTVRITHVYITSPVE
eukprot:Amastigsp_a848808_6.p3 type:complete len:107 gc:universal Amastigsp_a848808_6:496-176(-)